MPEVVKGTQATELLNDVMTLTLEKMTTDVDNRQGYLDAFKMILDTEFDGIVDDLKKTLIAYLILKERIVLNSKSN